MSRYNYSRRHTREVRIGVPPVTPVAVGGANPVRIQSMTNTSTLDTAASAAQCRRIAEAGGEIVRLTTQGVREADNMAAIAAELRRQGCDVPLVADVHFNPRAAYAAAETCDKVRINPGNFADAARTFRHLEFDDSGYAAELDKVRRAVEPLIDICRRRGVAVRLGVNHGSLSDRIMSRYGDTPEGMAESVMEYLRIFRDNCFDDVVISVKASNTVVMARTVRLLAEAMEREGMEFPLHLGVTEAGDGEDGRVKSAVGIGSLLADGLGDTIRVSLSEAPEAEIPVAAHLRDHIARRAGHAPIPYGGGKAADTPRALSPMIPEAGDGRFPLVAGLDIGQIPAGWHRADTDEEPALYGDDLPVVLTSGHVNPVGAMRSWIDRFNGIGGRNAIVGSLRYATGNPEHLQVEAAADFGALLLDGYLSGIHIDAPALAGLRQGDMRAVDSLALGILQACRLRVSKTEYIACPSCGRTLFDLQTTLAQIKAATAHLKGLKIGVMGCIVNGPGEMADADYGYVGAGPGRVSLYRGKEVVVKNIPASEAVDTLLRLIDEDRASTF